MRSRGTVIKLLKKTLCTSERNKFFLAPVWKSCEKLNFYRFSLTFLSLFFLDHLPLLLGALEVLTNESFIRRAHSNNIELKVVFISSQVLITTRPRNMS